MRPTVGIAFHRLAQTSSMEAYCRKLCSEHRGTGWSAGGFITAWTVTQTHRYKAAIEGAGDAKPVATPQLIQSAFQRALNPALSKAAGKVDHAGCLLGVWYNAKGTILVEQVIKSSGYPEIDQACLATAIGQPLTVPVLLDLGNGGWTQLPIVWNFGKRAADNKSQPMEADPAIPTLRQGDSMHVAAPCYPEAAVAARAHGICKLHVTVSDAGDVDALVITQSTGSADLDQACLDAIYDAPFIPGRREGKFVSGTTDIVLDWRLPEMLTPPNQLAR